jgi:hypothetical protein
MDKKNQSKCGRVVIFNHLEGYFDFLARSDADDTLVFRKWADHGDRALFWLGDRKLVIVSRPITDADRICRHWGYQGTQVAAPEKPSCRLSLDILRENHLIQAVINQAGEDGVVELVPYVATKFFYQLVSELRACYGLEVRLPESPELENLWLRDDVDTKAGFRDLATRWLERDDILPEGVVTPNVGQAGPAIKRFLSLGYGCVIKSNQGVNGMGNLIIQANNDLKNDDIDQLLKENNYFQDEKVVVERYIPSPDNIFPSLEIFVPRDLHEPPSITYLSQQLFDGNGYFEGVWIGRELLEKLWYPELAHAGVQMGKQLQSSGYVGYFDLDAIIDEAGKLYLLEINARRTGGTHVHEFAYEQIGRLYLECVDLLNYSHIPCETSTEFYELELQLGDLFFPINGEQRGVVISSTSKLIEGSIGCIFIGASYADAQDIELRVRQRLDKTIPAQDRP